MFTLVGIGMVATAVVFLVLGLVALIRCARAAIPETVRALSSWLSHPDAPTSLRAGHPRDNLGVAEGIARADDHRASGGGATGEGGGAAPARTFRYPPGR